MKMTKDVLIADLVDVIIDYMRIPEKPGQLNPIKLKDINNLAEKLFDEIYIKDSPNER